MAVDKDKLTQPFPKQALKQRSGGGGKSLTYVEGHTVVHRLNDATGNCWDFKVLNISAVSAGTTAKGQPQSLYTATVELCIEGLGCRQHVGVQMFSENAGEDLVKGVVTDGLKKAATLFGVGLELYGPDYEAGEIAATPRASSTRASNPYAQGMRDAPAVAAELNKPKAELMRPTPTNEQSPSLYPPRSGSGPTDPQRNFMNGLAKQLGWTIVGPDGGEHHDEAKMNAEIGLLYPGKTVDGLTTAEASAVIEQWQKIQADRRARLGIK